MNLSVTPERLLPRDSNPIYGMEAEALISGKVILVTGAGGSIGSEIVRQCRRLGAKRIIKVDDSEHALFTLSLDLFGHALFSDEDDMHLIDITDELAMSELIGEVKPDIVFHAAAKKHLPLLQKSPHMAIRVNVFGTLSVMKAASLHGVPQVVNISTDKAADPSSVLGWSKRLAELIGAHYSGLTTKVTSVRCGNVLGSNGSLLPVIQHKLDNNLPIQITHRDLTRFFMTIPEATGLVIEAAYLSEGGEVFILDMGTPVKIVDLVRDFARLSDRPTPEMEFIGLRPGEKLHEELFSSSESSHRTSHPRISVALVDGRIDVEEKLSELDHLLSTTIDEEVLRTALALNRKESYVGMDSATRASALLGSR